MMKFHKIAALALTASLAWTQQGDAAGFALIEQSISGQGRAFAGAAAVADDASTIFFNPAGMMKLCPGIQVVTGMNVIVPTADYKDRGSEFVTSISPFTIGSDNRVPPGETGRNAGVTGFVPIFYAAYVTDCFAIGIGSGAPFGLATEYTDTWVGRYHAIKSELVTINFNPSVAWRVNRCLSFGAGVNIMFAKAKLSNAVDGGLILASLGVPPIAGGNPQNNDFYAKVTGDGWGYGYNLGLLYEYDCCTRIGLAYRSKVVQHLHGDVEYRFQSPVQEATFTPFFPEAGAKADATLPGQLSLSVFRQYSPCLALMADVTWTHWHKLNELRIRFNSDQADSVTTLDWRDSWRYSVGMDYLVTPCLTLRSGVAYDQTPVPDEEHRTPRIPDQSRVWLSFGFGYQYNPCIRLDFGYSHLFVKDPVIDKDPTGEDFFRGGLKGRYDARTDIYSFGVSARF